jgi:opacity protein-like surface antigen
MRKFKEMMRIKYIVAPIITSIFFIGAADAAKKGAYVGANIGYSNLSNFTDARKENEGGVGGGVFAGYNFNQYIGIEAGFRKYADTNYQVNDWDVITFNYMMHSFTLVAKAYMPLGSSPFNLYFSLGLAGVYGKAIFKLFDAKFTSSRTELVSTGGIGVSYDINSYLTAGFDYSGTQGKNGNSDSVGIPQSNLVTLTIAYNFH